MKTKNRKLLAEILSFAALLFTVGVAVSIFSVVIEDLLFFGGFLIAIAVIGACGAIAAFYTNAYLKRHYV